MGSVFGSVPAAPGYRAPGGIATDISGGLSAFAQSLKAKRDEAALEAYRQAHLQLSKDELTQHATQAELDRQLKEKLGELEAKTALQVAHTRAAPTIQTHEEQDLARVRGEYDRQLKGQSTRAKEAKQARMSVLMAKPNRTPAEASEMSQLMTSMILNQAPELSHADSLAAFNATAKRFPAARGKSAVDALRGDLFPGEGEGHGSTTTKTPADRWEELVRGGMAKDAATAQVRREFNVTQ